MDMGPWLGKGNQLGTKQNNPHKMQGKAATADAATMTMYISEEIVEGVLLLLPIKSLMRFKCVCKTWQSLIQSRSFIDSYGRHRYSNNCLICSPYATTRKALLGKQTMFLSNNLIHLAPGPLDLLLPRKMTLRKCPQDRQQWKLPNSPDVRKEWKRVVRVLGPLSNGIYCIIANLHKISSPRSRISIATGKIALCNPATHDYKITSPFPSELYSLLTYITQFPCRIHYGFGITSENNDYKVGVIVSWGPQCTTFLSFVYRSGNDTWRKIADYLMNKRDDSERKATAGLVIQGRVQYPEIIQDLELCPQRFFRGCWHWMSVLLDRTYYVLSFNMDDEAFTLMRAPWDYYLSYTGFPRDPYVASGGVLVLNDHLAAISFTNPCSRIDLWMMMEYGVEESWTKIYAIQSDLHGKFSRLVGIFASDDCIQGVLYADDDKKQLISSSDVGSYVAVDDVEISSFICWNTLGISSYMETLECLS